MSSFNQRTGLLGRQGLCTESAGQVLLALTLIGLGTSGLVTGRFSGICEGVSYGLPGRDVLAYVCAGIALVCGLGLLWKRTASTAASVLLLYLILWLFLIKVPVIIASPTAEVAYESAGETAVLVAGVWTLYAWLSVGSNVHGLEFSRGKSGVRLARVLYALSLIAFGLSHFVYLNVTAPLVPGWLPAHLFWAYFFGSTYLAAAAALLIGVLARLAATLSALQMGLFTLLVWVPVAVTGHAAAGQWAELTDSWTMSIAAWIVAETYRDTPWLSIAKR